MTEVSYVTKDMSRDPYERITYLGEQAGNVRSLRSYNASSKAWRITTSLCMASRPSSWWRSAASAPNT